MPAATKCKTKQGISVIVDPPSSNEFGDFWEAEVDVLFPGTTHWHSAGTVYREEGMIELGENGQLERFLSDSGEDFSYVCAHAGARTTKAAAHAICREIEQLADSVGIPELVRRLKED